MEKNSVSKATLGRLPYLEKYLEVLKEKDQKVICIIRGCSYLT